MEPGRRDSLALLTDLYQFTMAYGYWRAGRQREPAEFELFFRRCPFRGGFALSAGLGECLAFLRAFRLREPGSAIASEGAAAGGADPGDHAAVSGQLRQTLKPLDGDEPVDFLPLAESWLRRVCQTLRVPHDRVNHGELAAFVSYAIAFPHNFQGLVDTYSIMGSGIPNFCAVALALNQLGYRTVGIRVDSGDLGKQAREIRQVLRTCSADFQVPWFATIPIAVSNDISERNLEELMQEGNEIDMIGIGTNLVTCPLQPSLGCVYKLVKVHGCPKLKLTEDEEKMTIPGSKVVYRLSNATGLAFMDLMALEEEPPPRAGQEVAVRLLGRSEEARRVTPTAVEILHRTYFKDGQVCQVLPGLLEIKSHAHASLSMLSPAHKRLQDPEPYQVAVTEKLHFLLSDLRRSSRTLSPPVERAAEEGCGIVTPVCLSNPLSPTIPLSNTLCWESLR
uniref:Nicotinate phosphoribosyltransferase n=1 Tax=Chrysemys picta bellii TaxID=8478 RepID=A0A8C3I2Y4_CHRPI